MRERERGGGQGVRDDVRRHRPVRSGQLRQVVEGAQLGRVRVAQPREAAVDQDVLDQPDLADQRRAEREADRDGAVHNVRLAHEILGPPVGEVVHAGDLGALEDPALVRRVRLERAVPVEVVGGDVEHGGGLRGHRVREVQLEARQLDDEDVERRVGGGEHDGRPDVAHRGDALPGGAQDRLEHPDGRRLAVGPRHGEPRRRAAAGRAVDAHRQASSTSLQTGHAAFERGGEQRVVRRHAGRRDDERGPVQRGARQQLVRADDVVGVVVDRYDAGAAGGEHLGRGAPETPRPATTTSAPSSSSATYPATHSA